MLRQVDVEKVQFHRLDVLMWASDNFAGDA